MKIITSVNQSPEQVQAGFTQQLFLRLNPPFPKVKLTQFDGCRTGDVVSMELNFLLFKQVWTSDITDDGQDENQWFFVDEGTQLPFFFKFWKHRHLILRKGDKTSIVDDITYKTPFLLFDWLLYPLLYLQFVYRKPIYKNVFR